MIHPDNFTSRKYVVIDVSDIGSVNFSQVLDTSSETLRKNSDSTQTFIKYDGSQPSSIAAISSRSQEYTYDQFKTLLLGVDWTFSTADDP
jgi:hypothetical protein